LQWIHEFFIFSKKEEIMDKDQIVSEYLKIYFSCHPGELPKDPDKAFQLISKLHKKYKNTFIDDFKAKSGKFVDKFMDDDKGNLYS
jgi:curved DNA-binding protein CbpA